MVRLNNQLNITSTCVKMKRIGNHVTKDGKKMDAAINDLIITAEANGIHSDCAQIFLIGPQSTRENLSEDEKSGIKKIISRELEFMPMQVIFQIHGAQKPHLEPV